MKTFIEKFIPPPPSIPSPHQYDPKSEKTSFITEENVFIDILYRRENCKNFAKVFLNIVKIVENMKKLIDFHEN